MKYLFRSYCIPTVVIDGFLHISLKNCWKRFSTFSWMIPICRNSGESLPKGTKKKKKNFIKLNKVHIHLNWRKMTNSDEFSHHRMVDTARDMLTPQAFYSFLHFKVWKEAQTTAAAPHYTWNRGKSLNSSCSCSN